MSEIVTWLGSGVAFSVGVFVGAWLMRIATSGSGEKERTDKACLVEMRRRNEIGIRQAEAMEAISMRLRVMLDLKERDES